MKLTINGVSHEVNVAPMMPLLWVLRDVVGLTGTKYSCGVALCGSCTVHLDGVPIRSCTTPVSAAAGRSIRTIEGLAQNGQDHPVQQAWAELNVPQCGYCQAGQLMSAAALLDRNPKPTAHDVDDFMAGNLCRCGTYLRIRQAVLRAAEIKAGR